MITFDGDMDDLQTKLQASRPTFVPPNEVVIWDVITSDPGPMNCMLVQGTFEHAVGYTLLLMRRRPDSWGPTCTVEIKHREIQIFAAYRGAVAIVEYQRS